MCRCKFSILVDGYDGYSSNTGSDWLIDGRVRLISVEELKKCFLDAGHDLENVVNRVAQQCIFANLCLYKQLCTCQKMKRNWHKMTGRQSDMTPFSQLISSMYFNLLDFSGCRKAAACSYPKTVLLTLLVPPSN